ncbi:protein O-mannosyl-transferase family [Thermodesulfobacteriota bacterium]
MESIQQIKAIERPSTLNKLIPAFLVIMLSALYLSTICPTVYLGDSGELTAAAFSLGIPHNSGYPLYTLIGKIFCMIPIGNIGFRMNLMSTFFAVITVWLVFSLILKVTLSWIAALTAAFFLAFTPLLWSQTVSAEVYTLHTFFVVLIVRILWWWDEKREFPGLLLFVFIVGISFGNHLQTLMLAPAVLFIILSVDKESFLNGKKLLILSLIFMVALSLYLYLPIRTEAGAAIHWGDPNNFERFIAHVTGKSHRSSYVFNKSPFEYMLRTKETLYVLYSQFGIILLMALWGWLKLQSVRWRIFFVMVVFFDSVYSVFLNIISLEITAFALPTCIVLTVLTGIGIAHVLRTISNFKAISGLTKRAAETVCCVVPLLSLFLNFSLSDQSRNYMAYDHALNIFRTLDNGSTLFMDGDNNIFPVTYGRIVERMREDVTLYDRYNLFFKMPYLGQFKSSHLKYYGKWKDMMAMLERKIIEKMVVHGVYFAVFNPFPVSMPDKYTFTPFGILYQVTGGEARFDQETANRVWDYYSTESLYDDFGRDYMSREVSAYFYFKKGKYHFSVGDPKTGIKYFRLASQIGERDNMIHSDMAVFLVNNSLFEDARKELEKALVHYEDLSGVHNNWGYYYYKLGNYNKAIESFEKAIELNPHNHDYYNNLGFNLYEIDMKKEALLAFQKSLAINGNQPKIKKFIKNHHLK